MKYFCFFIYIFLYTSCSFSEKTSIEVITILKINSEKNIDTANIEILKDEINKRMTSYSFTIKSQTYNKKATQLIIKSVIPQKRLSEYNSLFEKHSVEFWNTFLMSDEIFNDFDMENIDIEGFSPSKQMIGDSPDDILGFFYNEKQFDSIKLKLNEYFASIHQLEFYYLERRSLKSSNEFGIYLINTGINNEAPISNVHIKNAGKRETKYYPYQMIHCDLNDYGAMIWEKMTEKAAQENRNIAIVFDGKLVSCPAVHQKISGGKTSIVGFQDEEDLDKIAGILKMPNLSYHLTILSQESSILKK